MSTSFPRYELLLPTRHNDGRPIPDAARRETLLEIEARFGALSSETVPIHGRWRHEGKAYEDELNRVFVDVPDTDEDRQFFNEYKETLKARFQQLDIWITTHPIEVI